MSDAVRNLSDSSEEEEENKQNNSGSSDSNSDSDSSSSDSSDDSSSDSDSGDDSAKPSQQSDTMESVQTSQTTALPASDQAALDLDLSDDLDLVQDKNSWGSLDEIQQFLTNSVPTSVPGHCPVDPVFVDHEDSQHATQMDSLGKLVSHPLVMENGIQDNFL